VPETAARLDYLGTSFGGGIGALALPWDSRFTAGHLEVPSFGHHPLRIGLPCSGSGESVRRHVAAHPEAKLVLACFDAAVAASHLRIPMHIAAAVFDPAVPPAGQFAIYHAIPDPRKKLHVLAAGHHEFPGLPRQAAALESEVRAFFHA
jgi:cephalosporin-C deacetylase